MRQNIENGLVDFSLNVNQCVAVSTALERWCDNVVSGDSGPDLTIVVSRRDTYVADAY